MNPTQRPVLAYLVSRYPAVSHTFILREVARLRALGQQIETASINPPDRALDAMDLTERAEAERTYTLKRDGATGALAALGQAVLTRPLALARTLVQGWRMAGVRGIAYAVEAAMVARWMQRIGSRHLHVHFGNAGASVGVLTKTLSQCHLSYTIHGPDEFDDVPGQQLRLKMAAADAVVCISAFARSQLMRISAPADWAKLSVCRLGVDPAQFSWVAPSDHRGALRLVCVGRLTPAKGQVLLVQAAARLRARGLPFHLTLVGEGPDRGRIEAEVARQGLAHHVTLTGALSQDGVRRELARADGFVLPSFAEGIPVGLMEAMSSGVPCVSTPVNGIPELITHDHSGLLAVPGDVDQLADQLARLADPALRLRLAQAARERVHAEFNLDTNTARLSRWFDGFTAGVPAAEPMLRVTA